MGCECRIYDRIKRCIILQSISCRWGSFWGNSLYEAWLREQKTLRTKHGQLETAYTLGDPDPFDKFVIQVSTDKRYGTPTFKTIEVPQDVRANQAQCGESGMILQTEWSPGVNNEFLLPF